MFSKGQNKIGLKDDPYSYGYEVFNRVELVKEHYQNNHEPFEKFVKKESETKKMRPNTAMGDIKGHQNKLAEEQLNLKMSLDKKESGGLQGINLNKSKDDGIHISSP